MIEQHIKYSTIKLPQNYQSIKNYEVCQNICDLKLFLSGGGKIWSVLILRR